MTEESEKLTITFSGRTESEVDSKFTDWLRKTAGQVCKIERHAIEYLQMYLRSPKVGRPHAPMPDALSMLVEYELVQGKGKAVKARPSPSKRKKPTASTRR